MRRASVILAFLVALSAGSCMLGYDVVHFRVAVDSVAIPDSILAGGKLNMEFFGRLGPDQCWMLDRVDRQKDDSSYTVQFIGKHVVRGDCPQAPAAMDFRESLNLPLLDPFTVTVIQPSGQNLVRTVRVRPSSGG